MKKMLIGMFTVLSIFILSACGSDSLSGDYTGTVTLLWVESTSTMRFDGDSITEVNSEGEETNSGTYEIIDDELIMTINQYNIRAELSEDRESFTVTSADGLVQMLSGVTYTKAD